MEFLAGSLLELITETSTNLPPDVRARTRMFANQCLPLLERLVLAIPAIRLFFAFWSR